jgi:hypothetical protein
MLGVTQKMHRRTLYSCFFSFKFNIHFTIFWKSVGCIHLCYKYILLSKLCGCGRIMSLLLSNRAKLCLLMVAVSVCRRHPIPTREMLEPLLRTAAAVGLNLDVSSSKALADSLDHAVVCLCF